MIKKFIVFLLFTSTYGFAQYGYKDGNRIGISAGLSQTTLFTNNFNAKPELGFAGGLSVRGNYYNNWSMIYGMQFFANNFSLESTFDQLKINKKIDNLLFNYNYFNNTHLHPIYNYLKKRLHGNCLSIGSGKAHLEYHLSKKFKILKSLDLFNLGFILFNFVLFKKSSSE